jgi:dipeptidyl aminopeptidase/acylaminoacyl peptidase
VTTAIAMPQQPFEIESLTHPGQMIRGMTYLPKTVGRCPTLLMLHGFTGQRAESGFMFVQLARRLAAEGIACVTFDFRHSGESDGSFDQMLVTGELDDALRVTQWLAGQPFADRSRLGLLGFSLGGLLASCVTARTAAYKALVLLAPTTERNLARIAESRADDKGNLFVGAYQLHPNIIPDLLTLDSVSDSVKHPRPTLLVQGDKDTSVPPPVSCQYVTAMRQAGVPVEHVTIPNAEHTFSSPSFREQLFKAVSAFLAIHLKK